MATLFRNDWVGWTPNSDAINGNPKGLLRADNLTKDEDGVLSLIRGTWIVSNQLASAPSQIYAKILDLNMIEGSPGGYPTPAHLRYAVVGNQIIRNYGGAKREDLLDLGIISGALGSAAFGFGFGHVFITYGTQKWKDDGINQSRLGIGPPIAPYPTVNLPPTVVMRGSTFAYSEFSGKEHGGVFNNPSDYVEINSDPTTDRAIAIATLNIDANVLLSPVANGVGTDDDVYSIEVRIGDTSKLIKVRVEYLMQPPAAVSYDPDATDYYYYEWIAGTDLAANPNSTYFNPGINTWTTLQCLRSDFQRFGTNSTLNWSTIKGIRISFVTTEQQIFVFTNPKFVGGSTGPLSGEYEYIQVDVGNNGFYQERSLPSVPSIKVNPINTSVNIFPHTVNAAANECWIFRRGGSINDGYYYRVKMIQGAKGFIPAAFNDFLSDDDALRINIKLDPFQANLPDDIIGMETNFKGRNWYITYERVYPSFRDNVSSYDTRFVIDTGGNTEYNLFITKLGTDSMILATNRDFYEISGSAGILVENGIEYFDLTVRAMGIKSPSISKSFVVREGNLFYLASDGVRVLSGTSCNLLVSEIDLLFNHHVRHGINPVKIVPLEHYYLGIGNNRLYFSCQQENDNKRALYVFDLNTKIWRYEEHGDQDSIQALFVEEDDTVIYSTASFGDKFLRILDTGALFNQTDPINFKFLTVFDNNEQPRNRKDSFTLKIVADTGNTDIQVTLRGYRNDKTLTTFATTTKFDGREEKFYSIYTEMNVVKSYQLELSGVVPRFKLYNFSIDYDPRPEQLTNLRLPPSNFGVAGRKRISEIPMVIDTLGENVIFTPLLDGVAQTPETVNTLGKKTYNFLFPGNTTAINIGGLLHGSTGNIFEFYELVNPREIEVLPDAVRYKWVPYTNLGTGSRKRFIQYAIVIDTQGLDVIMKPEIDGVIFPQQIINTNRKQTVIYTFDSFAVGVDICCSLSGTQPFEFYEVNLSECVSEKLPPLAHHYHIPYTNFNTSSRKRISQFAFVIDTRGTTVKFTPMVDGIPSRSQLYNTSRKETVIYTFDIATVGIDMGGLLESLTLQDFEYYGPNLDDSIYEKLPPKTKFLKLETTNYGCAAKKRIRTIPMVLDTNNGIVKFTPMVDGVNYPSSTFFTTEKRTVLHYFENSGGGIPFGIDYGGTLESTGEFEFYGLMPPANVETLPIGKMFDQFGPVEFSKVGKIREISIRLVATGTLLNFKIYASDSAILSGSIPTVANHEKTYVVSVPKGVNPNIFRMEIDSPSVFHRYDAEVKVNIDGAQTENKRIRIKNPTECRTN